MSGPDEELELMKTNLLEEPEMRNRSLPLEEQEQWRGQTAGKT